MFRVSCAASILLLAAFGCGSDKSTGPEPVPTIAKVSGDAQQVMLGQTEPAPLVVSVTDVHGHPLAGTKVNWGIVSGGGSLSSSSTTTDQSGNASVMWTLGQSGDQVVKAWTDLARAPSVTFSANPITQVVTIVSGDAQKGPFNTALPAPLVVSVATSTGAPAANVKVNWGVVAGGGAVSSASSMTDQNGKAAIIWTLGPEPWLNQAVKAWTDAPGSQSASFSATGQATLVLHFDGSSWTRSLNTENLGFSLSKGWSASPSIAFAGGLGCNDPPVLMEKNGAWTDANTCRKGALSITSVRGLGANDVWAVGTGPGATIMSPHHAWIFHFDGSAWVTSFTDGDATNNPSLIAVAPRTAEDVVVVGTRGRILRHAGQQWFDQTSPTTNDLFDVWADPNGTAVFAVGATGTIVYTNATSWQTQASGTSAALHAIWGSSASDVFAVGDNGTILHFDGTSWSAQSSGTTQNLRGVWGSSPNSVYVVGAAGTLLHYDGRKWAPVSTGVQMDYSGVWGTSDSDVFVSGR